MVVDHDFDTPLSTKNYLKLVEKLRPSKKSNKDPNIEELSIWKILELYQESLKPEEKKETVAPKKPAKKKKEEEY